MFVAKNAWAELRRHPWRTALMVIASLLVTMWSVFGAAVMHEYHAAHGEGYEFILYPAYCDRLCRRYPFQNTLFHRERSRLLDIFDHPRICVLFYQSHHGVHGHCDLFQK